MKAAIVNTVMNTHTGEDMLSTIDETVHYQFLTFKLAGEEYGINITSVQEIKGWLPLTKIPNSPDFVSGVLKLRGNIVPVVDMRCRFNLDKVEYSKNTVIIVLTIDGDRNIGIVVDAVSDVLDVNKKDIKDPPDFGDTIKVSVVNGLAAFGSKLVMLLDINKMLLSRELVIIEDSIVETEKIL